MGKAYMRDHGAKVLAALIVSIVRGASTGFSKGDAQEVVRRSHPFLNDGAGVRPH